LEKNKWQPAGNVSLKKIVSLSLETIGAKGIGGLKRMEREEPAEKGVPIGLSEQDLGGRRKLVDWGTIQRKWRKNKAASRDRPHWIEGGEKERLVITRGTLGEAT